MTRPVLLKRLAACKRCSCQGCASFRYNTLVGCTCSMCELLRREHALPREISESEITLVRLTCRIEHCDLCRYLTHAGAP